MTHCGKITVRSLSELIGEVSNGENETLQKKEEKLETIASPETPQKIKNRKKAATTSRKRTHTVEVAPADPTTITTAKKSRSSRKDPLPGQLRIDRFYSSAAKTYKIEPKKEDPRDKKSEVTTSCKKGIKRQRTTKTPRRRRKALFKDDDGSTTSVSDDKKFVISSRKAKLKPECFIDLCESESDTEKKQITPLEIQDAIAENHYDQVETTLTGVKEVETSQIAVDLNIVGLITPVQSLESNTSVRPAKPSCSPKRQEINCEDQPTPCPKSSGGSPRSNPDPELPFLDLGTVAPTTEPINNEVEVADKCPPDKQPPFYRLRSVKKHEETPKTSNSMAKTKGKHKKNYKNKAIAMSAQKNNSQKQPSDNSLEQENSIEIQNSIQTFQSETSLSHKKQKEIMESIEKLQENENSLNITNSVSGEKGIDQRDTLSPNAIKWTSPALNATVLSEKHIKVIPSISETIEKSVKSNKESNSLNGRKHNIKSECSPTENMIVLSDGEQENHTTEMPGTSKKRGKQILKNSTQNTKTKKPRRLCPPYKVVEGTTFGVDAFNYGDIEGVTHYFLTHFHADHYVGLNRKFSHPVYMSSITADLLRVFIPIDEQYIHELALNDPVIIEDVEVTAIDANHCPGAIMLIFKTRDGRCTLHTGDFRASAEMESEPVFWNNDIHTIYLDTTYFPRKYDFCSQSESIDRAFHLLEEFNEKNVGTRILYVCGSYLVGKEKFWTAIARKLKLKVWAELRRKKTLEAIGDENILSFLVDDPLKAQLHVIPMVNFGFWALKEYIEKYSSHYDVLLAFRPSGWEKNSKPQFRGKVNIVGIEYSEHSSHNELKRFVQYLKPKKVISTVPVGKDPMKTAKIPDGWYRYDKLTGFQRNFQPSITNYFKMDATNAPKPELPAINKPAPDPSENVKIAVPAVGATDNSTESKQISKIPIGQAEEVDDWLT